MDQKHNPYNIISRFMEIAAIQAVSRHERKIIDFLKSWLLERKFDVIEDNANTAIGGNAGNLICKIRNQNYNGSVYLLAAHVDTVTPSCDKPDKVDGRIVSSDHCILGADDRVGVNIILEILEQISANKIIYPHLDVVFLIAEEIGLQGSRHLDYTMLDPIYGFNFDCSAPVGHAVVRAPNKLDFTVEIIGKESHAAVAPDKGCNAIMVAAQVLCKLEEWMKGSELTFNIGTIKGGGHTNIVPERAEINGEIRSFSGSTIQKAIDEIVTIVNHTSAMSCGNYEFVRDLKYPAFTLKEKAAVYNITKYAVESAGLTFNPISFYGGSDANIFNLNGIPSINLGLGSVNNHSSDEYITIDSLLNGAEIGLQIVEHAARFEQNHN